MPELTTREKLQTVRRNILADRIARAVGWCAFAGIVAGIAAPLAWGAWKEAGPAAALAVFALCVSLAWSVKPHGRSYAAQCRDIDARHGPAD